MLARAERAPGDLRHDRGPAGDLRRGDDARRELAADDRDAAERLAGCEAEHGEVRARRAAARRAVDLAVREDGHVALALREADAVYPVQLRLQRVRDLPALLDGALRAASRRDQLRESRRVDLEAERRGVHVHVEGAAERDRGGHALELHAPLDVA